jgi:GntR family transcriptional regulator
MRHPLLAAPRVERTLEASLAEKHDLDYMDIKRGSPILQLERLVKGEDGTPLEFLLARFRGDRFKYRLTG